MKKRVLILGSTGSVGESAVKVALALRGRVEVVGVVGNSRTRRLAEQAALLGCRFAATGDEKRVPELAAMLPSGCRALGGMKSIAELASLPEVDLVLCAIVGMSSLPAVLAAAEAGKTLALATKELLVSAGAVVMRAAAEHHAVILPVDSEHSAIFQCLQGESRSFSRLVLTCSGGPFRKWSAERLEKVTPAEALRHPTWNMGKKITVDSATLMNKAFEMIEAAWLFGAESSQIDVLVHPQSAVHSLVEFPDGSVKAQLSLPDMRYPIQYAFTFPERCCGGLGRLDLAALGKLEFERPDETRFPSLGFARKVLSLGGAAGAVLESANETAVDRFLRGKIGFADIWRIDGCALDSLCGTGRASAPSLPEILAAAREAARFAETFQRKA